jgi:hypothetical protein
MAFWNEFVPEKGQAWLHIERLVPFERIVVIDPIGDGYFPIPHVLVEFDGRLGPFRDGARAWFEAPYGRGGVSIRPTDVERVALFPNELPTTLYPPLPEFDPASGVAAAPLTEDGKAQMLKLTKTLAERSARMAEERAQSRSPDTGAKKLEAFVAWRNGVALPVLKRFEQELRGRAHEARIAVHSVGGARTPHESVELRVRLNAGGSHANADYRMEGHLRFEAGLYGMSEIGISMRPSAEPTGRYAAAKPPALNELTDSAVEKYVLGMLERLTAERN